MDNDELIARALARANMLLENPDVQGDDRKALFRACTIIEGLIERMDGEYAELLIGLMTAPIPPEATKRRLGSPQSKDNPLRSPVNLVAYFAALWARERGIENARVAAEQFLRTALGEAPKKKFVRNFQKRISEQKKEIEEANVPMSPDWPATKS